jgi:hypothetical protein
MRAAKLRGVVMPLHDWTDDRGWDSVHQLWINSLLFWLQERLPAGYRAYLGSVPGLTVAAEPGRPDIGIRDWQSPQPEAAAPGSAVLVEPPQPDFQTVALLNAEQQAAIHILFQGRLIAAIELVSPRNKDRPTSREFYRNRYLAYLWSGVHLMLVDVHRRPLGFSFVEAMAAEMQCRLPLGLPPHAVSWNVGGTTPEGGQFLDGWYRSLEVGQPLPTLPLSLTAGRSLLIDLEATYAEATRASLFGMTISRAVMASPGAG